MLEPGQDIVAPDNIERGEWLIEQQQLRIRGERPGNRHPLTFAAREGGHGSLEKMPDAQQSQRVIEAPDVGGPASPAQTKEQILPDVEVLGPAPAVIARVKEQWRWHMLVKAFTPASFAAAMAAVGTVEDLATRTCRVTLDVDPSSLMNDIRRLRIHIDALVLTLETVPSADDLHLLINQRIDLLDREFLVERLVEERNRRGIARTEALEREQRELAVVGRFVRLDPEAIAHVIKQLLMTAHFARDRLADANHAFANRLRVELFVERDGVHHVCGLNREKGRDLDHRLIRNVAIRVLDFMQDRHQRALLRCIARKKFLGPTILHRLRAVRLGARGDLGRGRWFGRPAHDSGARKGLLAFATQP
jgi:hypothetical protein